MTLSHEICPSSIILLHYVHRCGHPINDGSLVKESQFMLLVDLDLVRKGLTHKLQHVADVCPRIHASKGSRLYGVLKEGLC